MTEDPRIAELARTTRRRTTLVWVVGGILTIVVGVILLVLMLTASHEVLANDRGQRGGAGYQLAVLGGGLIVIGLFAIVSGIRNARQKE